MISFVSGYDRKQSQRKRRQHRAVSGYAAIMTVEMPPGWYDDPDGSPNAERRWDGHNWTPERRRKAARAAPPQAVPPPPPMAPPSGSYPQPSQSPPHYQQPPEAQAAYAQYGPPPQYPPPGPAQSTTTPLNLFSIIAFVCAGLALLGGMALFALPTIFGVAGIICAVVALAKKERLAPYAIGAAVGGLFLGWILQAAVFNFVFS